MNIKLNLKNNMAENKKYNSILVSGRKDETLTYSRYIKDEESGKSVKESLDEKISTTDKIEINQIAQAVWDKLKNEYLRLDGTNSMKGHLFLNGNTISGVRDIFQNDIQLGAVISLSNSDEIILKTIEVDGSEEPYHRILADFKNGEVSFPDGKVSSKGYKTTDRSNIGLLVNDGSVDLAMTDSDIDGLFQQVFQTVIG
jgi:hypothetical protein